MQKKLKEAQEEAEEEIARIKSIENEVRGQLDTKVSKFEKEYIPRATHESILAAEVLDLRTKNMNSIKELEEKYERDYAAKLKETIERNKQEYETRLTTLRSNEFFFLSLATQLYMD